MRNAVVLLVLFAPAWATPPELPGYKRLDELRQAIVAKAEQLRKLEEWERKPREEKVILAFARKDEKFENRRLTGEHVVKEIFEKWDALDKKVPEAEALRVLELLPAALEARYAKVTPIPKSERYKASKPLVKALTHEHFHLRKAAFDCLFAIYAESHFYKPDASPKRRAEKMKVWKKIIESKRR